MAAAMKAMKLMKKKPAMKLMKKKAAMKVMKNPAMKAMKARRAMKKDAKSATNAFMMPIQPLANNSEYWHLELARNRAAAAERKTMEEEQGHDQPAMVNLTQDADVPDTQELLAAEPQSSQSDSDCEGFCAVCGQRQDADAPDTQELSAAEHQSTQSDSYSEGFCAVCRQHFMPAHPTLRSPSLLG
jgi:hypothetical protein